MPLHDNDPYGPEPPAPPHHGGPVPHHRPPPHHRWIYNAEGMVTPAQVGKLFSRFASSIASAGEVELGGDRVVLPEEVRATVRHEILPRGELVVRVELVWNGSRDVMGRSISELLD